MIGASSTTGTYCDYDRSICRNCSYTTTTNSITRCPYQKWTMCITYTNVPDPKDCAIDVSIDKQAFGPPRKIKFKEVRSSKAPPKIMYQLAFMNCITRRNL